jgi:ABC-2 type transport system ATP-binding protein
VIDAVTAAVSLRDVTVRRGGRVVLDDITCAAATGSVTGVVGPSGCGKTTLMRAVVGVQRRVAGSVSVLGRPAGGSALRSLVGYLTQTPAVYADITVGANLRYFAAVVVGLTGEAGRRVDRLSGGQQARVALASVLLSSPQVLVLDEPTVGLDPVLRAELWETFRTLAAAGTTLLVSTHVMDEAGRCDRVLLLRDGRLLADERPGELLKRTAAADLDEAFLRLVQAAS